MGSRTNHFRPDSYQHVLVQTAHRQGIGFEAVRDTIEAFVLLFADAVWRKKQVRWPGVGTFTVRRTKPRRIAKPPQLGGPDAGYLVIKAQRVVKCRVAPDWRVR